MGNFIHPSAQVSSTARLGENNYIGPFCVIGPQVDIGSDNRFEAYCSIGLAAEHRDYFVNPGHVEIGNFNIIREFCTINGGTKWTTIMGNDCIMLRGSHLSHDSVMEDDVTLSCNVLVGGESGIMVGANVGLGAILHQRSCIGSYSMIGMGSVITKKTLIHPGGIYAGNPARFLKKNIIGLQRASISDEMLDEELGRWQKNIDGLSK